MTKEWDGRLNRGVTARQLTSGIYVFDAQDGTKSARVRGVFDDWRAANAYKADCVARRKNGGPHTRLDKDAWNELNRLGGRTVPVGLPAVTKKAPLPIADALTVATDAIAAGHKAPNNARGKKAVLIKFLKAKKVDGGVMDDVTAAIADTMPVWLSEENYARSSAGALLASVRRMWSKAVRYGDATSNPFEGLKALDPKVGVDRRGRRRDRESFRVWTWAELVAIGSVLEPVYRFAFWLAVLTGVRLSEIFGLQLGDWHPEKRQLLIARQRVGSPNKGTADPKSKAGLRWIPVASILASAIDEYISTQHGPRPESRELAREWDRRYLVAGTKKLKRLAGARSPMNPGSFVGSLRRAYNVLGLTEEALGFSFAPTHILRHGFATELVLKMPMTNSGKVASVVLGHQEPFVTSQTVGASSTTTATYQHLSVQDLELALYHLDETIERELVAAFRITDLLALGGATDGCITLDRAQRVLGLTRHDIMDLVRSGHLGSSAVEAGKLREIVVSESDVADYARAQAISAAETYSAEKASDRLAVTRDRLYALVADGTVIEVTENAAMRVMRRGGLRGTLPGGGRRFERAAIDELAEEWRDRIERVSTWLTVGQAANLLSCSTDTARRLADDGRITSWRDPISTRGERYLCPQSVAAAARRYASFTLGEASARLGTSTSALTAAIKTGDLATSPALGKADGGRRPVLSLEELERFQRARLEGATIEIEQPDGSLVTGRICVSGDGVRVVIEVAA